MKKYILSIIVILITIGIIACPSPNEDDTTPPEITDFTLNSDDPSTLPYINFTLNGTDNVGITGWLVKEDSTDPETDDEAWMEDIPEFFRFSSDGNLTLYAWAKDEAGNISESASISVTYNKPTDGITEDDIYWDKRIDSGIYDGGYGIAVDSDNNIYSVGFGSNLVSGSSAFDWWIKKFDQYGREDTTNWDKSIDGGGASPNGNYDEAYSVACDSQNNVYIIGYVGVTENDSAWMIKKFSSDGTEDTSWNKTFNSADDGTTTEEDTAFNIVIDSQDNVYVSGAGYDVAGAGTGLDWWIKKFSSDGTEDTTNWDKKIDGNGGNDYAFGIAVDSQDNIYVAGVGDDIVDGSSNWDWWIKKFSSDGTEDTTNWNKMYSSASASRMDRLYSVTVDEQDNVWLAGSGRDLVSGSSGNDWWIKKFSSDGTEDTTNWDLMVDSGNEDHDQARELVVDYENSYVYVLGYGGNLVDIDSIQDWWLKRFNLDGTDSGWEVYYKGNGPDPALPDYLENDDYAISLIMDQNGDLYANGQGIHLASSSSSLDWWIKKFVIDE